MSCKNSRNLMRNNDFSTAHGLHTSFYAVFESNKVWFHLSGYINSQNSRICNAENPNTVPFMKGHYTH